MPQSLANFDAALKDTYGPGLRNALNNSNPIFTEVMRNDEDIVGRRAVWSVHTGRSTSTGARAELAALPSADRQRFSQMNEDLAYVYHTVKVSGQAKHLTRGDEGSFARALESEIDGAEKDMKLDLARQVFGDVVTISGTRYTGAMARVNGAPAANVFTLNSPDDTAITPAEMRYFFINEIVDVIASTTGAVRGSAAVTAINKSAGTVTLASTPASSADDDYIARTGSFGQELNGLRYLISDTSVFAGVDPATVPSWAAVRPVSGANAISEVLLDQIIEGVETDGDGSTPSLYLFSHLQRRKLASTLQSQKRFEGREITLKAGWRGLQIAQGTLVADRFNPDDEGFAITPKELTRFVGLDFTWDDDDGKVLYKALDDSDAVQARYKAYMNLVTTNRNSHARVNLTIPTF